MDYFYIPAGMFVIIIALWKRELLIQKESSRIILGVSVALFLAGLVLHFIEADRDSSSGALLTPLMSLGLYRLCRKFFIKRLKHEPMDTYLNWQSGLGADRLFNIAFFGLSFWLFLLTTIGMMKLARAGW